MELGSDTSGGGCDVQTVVGAEPSQSDVGASGVGTTVCKGNNTAAQLVDHREAANPQQQQQQQQQQQSGANQKYVKEDDTVMMKNHSVSDAAVISKEVTVPASADCGNNSFDCPDSSDNGLVNGKKRRHRRKQKGGKHHRKWKPYDKLTWDERQTLEERECRRACKKRETRFASGQAMAPYNTTQFLMEQHEPSESDLQKFKNHPPAHAHRNPEQLNGQNRDILSGSGDGSSEEYSNEEEEIFLEKEFSEAYEQFHVERLQGMTKPELVKEHMDLECEVDNLKRQVRDMESETDKESAKRRSLPATPDDDMSRRDGPFAVVDCEQQPSFSVVAELQKQIKKLKDENTRLSGENGKLKTPGSCSRVLQKQDKMDTSS